MNIFILIGIFLIAYAFFNYKKAFILFLIFRLFLNQNINLVNIPGIPLLTLEFMLVLLFWFIYFIKRNSFKIDHSPFPLKSAFIFLFISHLISSVFGIAGIGNSFSALIKVLFEDFVSVWLVWVLLKKKKDYIFLIKGITIAFFFAGIYSLYEAFTHLNPIMDYEILIAGTGERVIDWNYGEEAERGYRIKSIFLHAIGCGMNFVLYFLVILYLWIYSKKSYNELSLRKRTGYTGIFSIRHKWRGIYPNKIRRYYFSLFVAFLSIACAFLSNSRGPLMFLLIGLLPFYNIKNRFQILLLIFGIIITIAIYNYNNALFDNLFSIFSKSAQENVGGSNLEMRVVQLSSALTIMKENPICGIGIKGIQYYPNQILLDPLLGMESMWFKIIIEQGILGILTTLFLIFVMIYKMGLKSNKYIVLFLSIAYFVTFSMTSLPGFAFYLFYTFIFMFYKKNSL